MLAAQRRQGRALSRPRDDRPHVRRRMSADRRDPRSEDRDRPAPRRSPRPVPHGGAASGYRHARKRPSGRPARRTIATSSTPPAGRGSRRTSGPIERTSDMNRSQCVESQETKRPHLDGETGVVFSAGSTIMSVCVAPSLRERWWAVSPFTLLCSGVRSPAIRSRGRGVEPSCPASPRDPREGLGPKRTNMVDRNLLREFDVSDEELIAVVTAEGGSDDFDRFLGDGQNFEIGGIVTGKVIEIVGDEVVVDVGYKSEGLVAAERVGETSRRPKPGDAVEVLLEAIEDETGEIVLSYRKAKRQKEWEMVISKHKEGDVVTGQVTRKIKGGLLVNIGVNVFLPASQVDIRRPADIGDYIDQDIECKILKIDEARRNIVVSRRKLIEDHARAAEEEAARRDRAGPGPQGHRQEHRRVRRVRRPRRHRRPAAHHRHELGPRQPTRSDMVKIDQELEVYILNVDKDKEKIALGLKQKTPSPWAERRGQVPGRQPAHGRGRQRHELRRLRQARAGHRGPGPHLRDELDQADQPPERAGADRRQDRGAGPRTSTRTSRKSRWA